MARKKSNAPKSSLTTAALLSIGSLGLVLTLALKGYDLTDESVGVGTITLLIFFVSLFLSGIARLFGLGHSTLNKSSVYYDDDAVDHSFDFVSGGDSSPGGDSGGSI